MKAALLGFLLVAFTATSSFAAHSHPGNYYQAK